MAVDLFAGLMLHFEGSPQATCQVRVSRFLHETAPGPEHHTAPDAVQGAWTRTVRLYVRQSARKVRICQG